MPSVNIFIYIIPYYHFSTLFSYHCEQSSLSTSFLFLFFITLFFSDFSLYFSRNRVILFYTRILLIIIFLTFLVNFTFVVTGRFISNISVNNFPFDFVFFFVFSFISFLFIFFVQFSIYLHICLITFLFIQLFI